MGPKLLPKFSQFQVICALYSTRTYYICLYMQQFYALSLIYNILFLVPKESQNKY
jgi:hypothetical protein